MFAPSDALGQQLVLIDWAYVGRGEIGLDIADLFGASYSTFGVEPTDPRTFAAVAVILCAVALTASYVPAMRASRLDPLRALRQE